MLTRHALEAHVKMKMLHAIQTLTVEQMVMLEITFAKTEMYIETTEPTPVKMQERQLHIVTPIQKTN